ncbi:hypothetical protein PR202_gb13248 [Eleusine coracana subsp. coracana]|uniref:Ultraviolet-B receptor UVR8 n=1 Tax=Eleusine coracana subsp. coracana TaxID=191504 RepID=A0AAV5EPR4_ELECO|nr:hypothetical protein PR202_gb13248 [Eleusine coracana subsp. coracana]
MWRATARRWPWMLRSTRSRWLSSGAEPEPPQRVAALWGNGDYGRLGLGALESQWSPTACPFFLDRAGDPPVSLACGGAHTLFLTQSGRVFATGLNDFGQLGIGSSVTHTLEPVEILGIQEKVVEIAAGNHHSCAVSEDGNLFIWGRNSSGQLGLGKSAGKLVSTPTKVDYLADCRIKMAALGSEHSIAVTGKVLSWGAAGAGRLGHGHKSGILGFSLTSRLPRIPSMASVANLPPKSYSDMSLRELIDLLKARLEAKEEAANRAAVLAQPVMVVPAAKEKKVECVAVLVQTSSLFLAALTVPGFGRLNEAFKPIIVEELPFSEEVACGGYHTCVVTDSGFLYSWGTNENGCLGLGVSLTRDTDMVRSPEILKSSLFKLPVSKVSCGWKHTAVISGDDIYTWGWGGANGTFFEDGHSSGGQLGHGDDVDYFVPMMVTFGKNARAVHVSCGFNHTGAIYEFTEN